MFGWIKRHIPVRRKFDALVYIILTVEEIMSAVTDVQDAVAAQTTVVASTQTLVQQVVTIIGVQAANIATLAQELADANEGVDTTALQDAVTKLKADTDALSAADTILANAVTANTPTALTEPPAVTSVQDGTQSSASAPSRGAQAVISPAVGGEHNPVDGAATS